MFTRPQLQAVVPQVLQRLQAITDLPTHGTVAGQAVASLFFEELGLDMRGPVNDVDVFVSVGGKHVAGALSMFSSEEDKYRHIKFISSQKNLSIVSTSTQGLLNTTTITYPGAYDGQSHTHAISRLLVEGFDLNGVAVGINLHTNTVVCSAEFLRFLEHREMKVVSTLTPAHTLVRLARKMHSGQLHHITCDYAQQRELLEQFMFLTTHSTFEQKCPAVLRFGERYKAQVEQLQNHLPSMKVDTLHNDLFAFEIQPTVQRERVLHQLLPLAEKLGGGGVAFLFHYNFDRLLDTILANQPYGISIEQLLETAADNTVSDGAILSCANQMMGGQPLVYPMGMDDNDCAVAFLQYDHRNDPCEVQTIVGTYTQLSQFEKDIFTVDGTLNDLLDFSTHPVDFAYAQLEKNNGLAFAPWANSLRGERDVELFVTLMERVGHNETLRAQLISDFADPGVKKYTYNVFDNLGGHDRRVAFNSVIEHIYLGVNTLFTLNTADQRQLVGWMHHNSIDLKHVFPRMSSQQNVAFLMSGEHPTQPTTEQLNNVSVALNLVSDDCLMENNGSVLRSLLRYEFLPLLQDRVSRIDAQLWNARWVEKMLDILGNSVLADNDKKSIFENVMLFRAIGQTKTNPTRRKM